MRAGRGVGLAVPAGALALVALGATEAAAYIGEGCGSPGPLLYGFDDLDFTSFETWLGLGLSVLAGLGTGLDAGLRVPPGSVGLGRTFTGVCVGYSWLLLWFNPVAALAHPAGWSIVWVCHRWSPGSCLDRPSWKETGLVLMGLVYIVGLLFLVGGGALVLAGSKLGGMLPQLFDLIGAAAGVVFYLVLPLHLLMLGSDLGFFLAPVSLVVLFVSALHFFFVMRHLRRTAIETAPGSDFARG